MDDSEFKSTITEEIDDTANLIMIFDEDKTILNYLKNHNWIKYSDNFYIKQN